MNYGIYYTSISFGVNKPSIKWGFTFNSVDYFSASQGVVSINLVGDGDQLTDENGNNLVQYG